MTPRLAGHTLVHEGAAHRLAPGGRLVRDHYRLGSGGMGRAACSCGAYSAVLASGSQRKAWHRDHKATTPQESAR